jgi:UDP-N-acetylmuramate dehydrogenase
MTKLIAQQVSLKPYNTLGIDVCAEYFMAIRDVSQLEFALDFSRRKQCDCRVIGGGSNIVLRGHISGLVVHMQMRGIGIEPVDEQSSLLIASAGENWDQLVQFSLEKGLYGLENLSLIPGSVGAAPVQNIGAYGVEISELVEWVEVWNCETLRLEKIHNKDCMFAYRDSVFKHKLKSRVVITRVALRLSHQFKPCLAYAALQEVFNKHAGALSANSVREQVIALRSSKLPDPRTLANVGSFFKNPVITREHYQQLLRSYPAMPAYALDNEEFKLPAAWLIDSAGWKGKSQGDVGVHDQQALVLVNKGQASGEDVLQFAEQIQVSVHGKFAVVLDIEPEIIP